MCRLISRAATGLFFLLCQFLAPGSIAYAQQYPGQWADDLYLVSIQKSSAPPSVFVDENNIIRKRVPPITEADGLPVSSEYLLSSTAMYWHKGALYALATGRYEMNENGLEVKRWTLAKWEDEDEGWHFLGGYITDRRGFIKIIPCDNGRFIFIYNSAYGIDLTGNAGPDKTPFARMSIAEGKTQLKIDAPIAHGMDDDIPISSLFAEASGGSVIIADKYAVLLSKHTGLYWIFSLETATLKHAGKIFGKATPEWIANGGNSKAILCANPEKDGTVLVSAQKEDVILSPQAGDAMREFNDLNNNRQPTGSPKSLEEILEVVREAQRTIGEREQELKNKNPFTVWYRIYPEGGRVERDIYPDGAALIREDSDIWRPMPDGSVKMGVPIFTEKEAKKEVRDDGSNTVK